MRDWETIDFFTDQSLVEDPYPYFEQLRAAAPVLHLPHLGVVAVTGYDEACEIYRDTESFSSCNSVVGPFAKEGLLAGDPAIGIVRPDFSTHAELARTLTKALTKAGFEVVEEVALPCDAPISPCQQVDVGALRLQTRNVDTVFSLLGALAYPGLVGAARDIRFEPQWLSSDFEFQVYDTVLMFMEDVKGAYDGAVGISTILDIERPDGPRTECNERWVQAGGEEYEPLSDAWQNVGTNCLLADRIVRAANAAQESGRLTQESFIREFEKLPLVEGKRQGSYTAKKHDGYDAYQLYEFDAGCVCWESIKGSVTDDEG